MSTLAGAAASSQLSPEQQLLADMESADEEEDTDAEERRRDDAVGPHLPKHRERLKAGRNDNDEDAEARAKTEEQREQIRALEQTYYRRDEIFTKGRKDSNLAAPLSGPQFEAEFEIDLEEDGEGLRRGKKDAIAPEDMYPKIRKFFELQEQATHFKSQGLDPVTGRPVLKIVGGTNENDERTSANWAMKLGDSAMLGSGGGVGADEVYQVKSPQQRLHELNNAMRKHDAHLKTQNDLLLKVPDLVEQLDW